MSGFVFFVKKKTFYVVVLPIHQFVTIVLGSGFYYIQKELEKVDYFGQNAVLFNEVPRQIKWQIHTNYIHPRKKSKLVFIEESILNMKLDVL